jgi:RNA polymerase sigma-70 factor, ECF subfamily
MQTANNISPQISKFKISLAIPTLPSALSDESLLAHIAIHDDQRAFEILFNRHYKTLCRYVFTILQCKHTTEEVVSDVFMKIWNQRETLQIQCNLKSYLLAAVRNLSIDHLRKQARRRTVGEEAINIDLPSAYSSAHDTVVGDELIVRVEAAIDQLPKQGRIIFRLSRDGNMKYREIADHLGLSIKTVETHMTRSLLFLRQELLYKE